MDRELLAQYQIKDTTVIYVKEGHSVGLILVPRHKAADVKIDKGCDIQPLVQLKLTGDAFNDRFTNGLTMSGSQSTKELCFVSHQKEGSKLITTFKNDKNHYVRHYLVIKEEYDVAESYVEFENRGNADAVIEMLLSFSFGQLTPFEEEETPGTLIFHRLQSFWSAEGRLQSTPVEHLMLERSWKNYGMRCEKFGQTGSMPVRRYFPFMALEDTANSVTWGVQLYCASSWQMEISRYDSGITLAGGLADRDFGHWKKCVRPNQSFQTPKAVIAVCQGGIDEITNKLVHAQSENLKHVPKVESELPVVFNEFCTTWGNPTLENIKKIADTLKGKGIKYLVIDCGWYKDPVSGWETTIGDWVYSTEMFPNGLKDAADYIKQCGMIPGIWFEMEVTGRSAKAFHMEEHLLKRDGAVITTGDRRFWDMADPWVDRYLTEKVIGLLKECGFGYVKIDYNDNIGIGCDGAESLGEGLRQRVLATQEFFKKIRAEIPDIVIENCSSGGHRLEPSMMALVSQASFSDAHECVQIPIIAANCQRAVHPAQSQIWAVLRSCDSVDRLYYSMINTFLGRMCLSGDVYDLTREQWRIVDEGIAFYKAAAHIIKNGASYRYGKTVDSYNHPTGYQAVLRKYKNQALLTVHIFDNKEDATVKLPERYAVVKSYGSDAADIEQDRLRIYKGSFKAKAFILERDAE